MSTKFQFLIKMFFWSEDFYCELLRFTVIFPFSVLVLLWSMESSNEIYVFYGKTICYLFPRIVLSLLLQYIQSSWTGKIFLLYCFQKFPYFFFAVRSWIYHVRYFLYFTFIFFNIYKKDFKETEAAARGVLHKKVFWKISQVSEETSCAGVPSGL